jgi:anti-anti-sigma factor
VMLSAPFEAERRDGVVYLRGDLDLSVEDRAARVLLSEAHRGRSLTLDLSALTFCSSAVVRVVAEAVLVLGEGSTLQVIGASRSIRKLFDISGVSRHPAVLIRGPSALSPD